MKTSNVLHADTLLTSCADIRKAASTSSILRSLLLLLLAGGAYILSLQIADKSSPLYMALVTSAIVLTLYGLYRLFTASSQIIYVPTGSPLQKRFSYFESEELPHLRTILSTGNFAQLATIRQKQGGNVRLDCLLSQDGCFIALQLYQYIPYTYEPVTEVMTFRHEDAKTLSAYLRRK